MSRLEPDRCLVKGCDNRRVDGGFAGDLCVPCHTMLASGIVGHGTTFVHDMKRVIDRAAADLSECSTGSKR